MNDLYAINSVPFNRVYKNPAPGLYVIVTITDANVWGRDPITNDLHIINRHLDDGSGRRYAVKAYTTYAEAKRVHAVMAAEHKAAEEAEAARYAAACERAEANRAAGARW